MTRPLRRAHLLIWLIVAPGAVGVLLLALALRPRVPVQSPPDLPSTPARNAP